MLATQMNQHIINGAILKNSLIQMSKFVLNHVQTRRIVIILEINIVATNFANKIGDPINVEEDLEVKSANETTNNNNRLYL